MFEVLCECEHAGLNRICVTDNKQLIAFYCSGIDEPDCMAQVVLERVPDSTWQQTTKSTVISDATCWCCVQTNQRNAVLVQVMGSLALQNITMSIF